MDRYISEKNFSHRDCVRILPAYGMRRRSFLSLLAALVLRALSLLFTKRTVRCARVLLVLAGAALFLGLVGGIESGSVPLWIGGPACFVLAGSAAYEFFGKS